MRSYGSEIEFTSSVKGGLPVTVKAEYLPGDSPGYWTPGSPPQIHIIGVFWYQKKPLQKLYEYKHDLSEEDEERIYCDAEDHVRYGA